MNGAQIAFRKAGRLHRARAVAPRLLEPDFL
jgi:hypothetical protein